MFACMLSVALGPVAHAAPPAGPVGIWLGKLDVGPLSLRIAFHVEAGPDGALQGTMDSLDQGARGLPLDEVRWQAPTLRLALAQAHAVFEGKLDGDKLVGTFTQGRAFPLSLSRVAASALDPPKRPQTPKRPFPYREEEVTLEVPARSHAGTIRLAGTLSLPSGRGPFPALLFVTGSGSQDRDETIFEHKPFLVLSDALVRAGIATLRFDDRGVGRSGGSAAGVTTLDLAEDARAELTWLASRAEVDRRAIGILGHSEGGVIAPIVAASSTLPRFLVLLAGTGVPGREVIHTQQAALLRAAGKTDAEVAEAVAANDRLLALIEHEHDPAVLALDGERDLQVDPSNLALIARALGEGGNHDVTVKRLPALNHLFQHAQTGGIDEYARIEETMSPEVLTLVRDFVRAHAPRYTGSTSN
jgi:hypothetical protein